MGNVFLEMLSRSNLYKCCSIFSYPFHIEDLQLTPRDRCFRTVFAFVFLDSYIFISDQNFNAGATEMEMAFLHSLSNDNFKILVLLTVLCTLPECTVSSIYSMMGISVN